MKNVEKQPPLKLADIERLERLYSLWWAKAHRDDEEVYARAKHEIFGLAMEMLPGLCRAARLGLRRHP